MGAGEQIDGAKTGPNRKANRNKGVANPVRRRPGRPTLSNEELLDTALDLFLEHGFERTSIDAITSAAGMAKRTVYARYGDKTNLFKAALERAIEEWIVPVERLREAESDDLEETLLRIGGILVANITSPAGLRLLRLTNAVSGRMPEIGAFNVKLGTEPTLEYLADLFGRRLSEKRKDIANPRAAAQAFLDLMVAGPASTASWGVEIDRDELDRQTRYGVQVFLHGVLPQERGDEALEEENRKLKALLAETLEQLDRSRERIAEACRSESQRIPSSRT